MELTSVERTRKVNCKTIYYKELGVFFIIISSFSLQKSFNLLLHSPIGSTTERLLLHVIYLLLDSI